MLLTDGITHVMSDEEISQVLAQCGDSNEGASRLVDQALLHASEDNCTALVLPLGAWGKVTIADIEYYRNIMIIHISFYVVYGTMCIHSYFSF